MLYRIRVVKRYANAPYQIVGEDTDGNEWIYDLESYDHSTANHWAIGLRNEPIDWTRWDSMSIL
jgi:hypothetical protein